MNVAIGEPFCTLKNYRRLIFWCYPLCPWPEKSACPLAFAAFACYYHYTLIYCLLVQSLLFYTCLKYYNWNFQTIKSSDSLLSDVSASVRHWSEIRSLKERVTLFLFLFPFHISSKHLRIQYHLAPYVLCMKKIPSHPLSQGSPISKVPTLNCLTLFWIF